MLSIFSWKKLITNKNNNTISNCKSQGIDIFHNSKDNKIHDNTVVNTTKGIEVTDDCKNNVLSNNTINGKKDADAYLGEGEEDQGGLKNIDSCINFTNQIKTILYHGYGLNFKRFSTLYSMFTIVNDEYSIPL